MNDDMVYAMDEICQMESYLISLERCKAFTRIETEAPAETDKNLPLTNYDRKSWPENG